MNKTEIKQLNDTMNVLFKRIAIKLLDQSPSEGKPLATNWQENKKGGNPRANPTIDKMSTNKAKFIKWIHNKGKLGFDQVTNKKHTNAQLINAKEKRDATYQFKRELEAHDVTEPDNDYLAHCPLNEGLLQQMMVIAGSKFLKATHSWNDEDDTPVTVSMVSDKCGYLTEKEFNDEATVKEEVSDFHKLVKKVATKSKVDYLFGSIDVSYNTDMRTDDQLKMLKTKRFKSHWQIHGHALMSKVDYELFRVNWVIALEDASNSRTFIKQMPLEAKNLKTAIAYAFKRLTENNCPIMQQTIYKTGKKVSRKGHNSRGKPLVLKERLALIDFLCHQRLVDKILLYKVSLASTTSGCALKQD